MRAPERTESRCRGSNSRRSRAVRHTARSEVRRQSGRSSVCHPRRTRWTGCQATRTERLRLRCPESASPSRWRPVAARSDTRVWRLLRRRCSGHRGRPPACVALPVPPAAGPPNDVFSGGAMVNRAGPSAGVSPLARRMSMTAVAISARANTAATSHGTRRDRAGQVIVGALPYRSNWTPALTTVLVR